jgi:hypothetical protein
LQLEERKQVKERDLLDSNAKALRSGQRDALKVIFERSTKRDPYTAIVIPTRYGKTDLQRIAGVQLHKHGVVSATFTLKGGDRRSETFKNQTDNVRLKHGNRADYIRARLKRDGQTEMLAKIEPGETTAHAAAIELGWRARMIQYPPTVEGFMGAISKHLSTDDIERLLRWIFEVSGKAE